MAAPPPGAACADAAAVQAEQWRELLLQQPWSEEHRLRVCRPGGAELDPDGDREAFVKSVTAAPVPPGRLKVLERGWCLHRGFGACCDPAAFHLPGVWRSVRQSRPLYRVARALLGRRDLWVDINRSIQKLPRQVRAAANGGTAAGAP